METQTLIRSGKYEFKITENKLLYGADRIISHTYRIGGNYDNCISVSYTYNNNKPISAKIPHALYEPECSIAPPPLEKGAGTVLMLKTLLKYVYSRNPTVHIFSFDDMSHIDCIEKDTTKSIPRPPTKPLNLAYLSIAYNSKTWYELYFNAKMSDKVKYKKYEDRLNFLINPKEKVDFLRFLEIAKPPQEQHKYLEAIYKKSTTYRELFEAIPKTKRCDVLFDWLTSFMEYYLKDVYSPYNWEININEMKNIIGGSRRNLYSSTYKLVDFRAVHPII